MKPSCRAVVRAALGLVVVAASATATIPTVAADDARDASAWLESQQKNNGAFFTTAQKANDTAITIAAAAAGGLEKDAAAAASKYIASKGPSRATRGGYTGQMIAGLVAIGADPRDHGGFDYVEALQDGYSSGRYDSTQFFDNLLGANGALAAGIKLPSAAVSYITGNECPGGGWGFDAGCPSGADVDTTALAINVLAATGKRSDATVGRGRSLLLARQRSDGGFGFASDKPTSADSTGLALTAIAALGEDPKQGPWKQPDGDDPLRALRGLRHPSGGFKFIASASKPNAMSTINAIPGLEGIAYPIEEQDLLASASEPKQTNKPKPTSDPDPGPGTDQPKTTTQPRDEEAGQSQSRTPSATSGLDAATSTASVRPDGGGTSLSRPSEGEGTPPSQEGRRKRGKKKRDAASAPFAGAASESTGSGSASLPLVGASLVAATGGIALGFRWLRGRRLL